jgi:hypothetical protein
LGLIPKIYHYAYANISTLPPKNPKTLLVPYISVKGIKPVFLSLRLLLQNGDTSHFVGQQ